MKLGYSANAYMKYSLPEAIQHIASLGYNGLEILADKPHAWPETVTLAELEAIGEALAEHQLEIANINAFMMNQINDPRQPYWYPSWLEPDLDYRRVRTEHTKRALTLAKRLGAKCITTEPGGPVEGDMTWESAFETFVEELKPVYEHAEAEGVMLLIEPEPELLIETSDQFLKLADRIDSPMFGLNFDIGHLYCVNEDLVEAVHKLKKWTRHYHLEDIAATRVHQHLVPGDGAIEFGPVIEAIKETGYNDFVTVELYLNIDNPNEAGKRAYDLIKPLLEA